MESARWKLTCKDDSTPQSAYLSPMPRFLMLIAILFAATTLVLYATDSVRKHGPAILTAALGAIVGLVGGPFSLILGLMYLTGGPGEAAYALRELYWLGPMAGAGVALFVVSAIALRRRPPPAEE